MAEAFTSYSVDNDKKFREALSRARGVSENLSVPLNLIARDFYRSEKAIWKLTGPGQYPDLAESTKRQRVKRNQATYPILKVTGALERSMTDPSDPNAINSIVNKTALVIGTLVDYGVFHQSDASRSKIPLRKFLFIGPEAPRFASSDQAGRLQRWTGIINAYIMQKINQELGSSTAPGSKSGDGVA